MSFRRKDLLSAFPRLYILVLLFLNESDDYEALPFFLPGEEELVAMTVQLKTMKSKADHRKIYKADGIIRNKDDLEVMMVETAGKYGSTDNAKATFDNSKGCLPCWQC